MAQPRALRRRRIGAGLAQQHLPARRGDWTAPRPRAAERALLARYIAAHERGDAAAQAFAGQDTAGQAALAADLDDLLRRHNRATDGTIAAPADYLEVVATRR